MPPAVYERNPIIVLYLMCNLGLGFLGSIFIRLNILSGSLTNFNVNLIPLTSIYRLSRQ
jgi:hypothetical protein